MSEDVTAIMARLADPEEIAAMLNLESVKRQPGGGVMARCPVHGDKTPSLSLTCLNGTLRVKCFGCDLAGNVFHLIAGMEGWSTTNEFPKVLKRACAMAGITQEPFTPKSRPATVRPSLPPLDLNTSLGAVLRLLDEREPNDVTTYLADRGLLAEAIADRWMWLSLTELKAVVFERQSMGGDPMREQIAAAGLIRENEGQLNPNFHTHTLVIPYRDRIGRLMTIQRRALGPHEKKYVLAPGRPVEWPCGFDQFDTFPKNEPVVLVEGAIDMLARRRRGGLVLGCPGVQWQPANGWGDIVKNRDVVIAFDRDDAGETAATKLVPKLQAVGARTVLRQRPKKKDWAEL